MAPFCFSARVSNYVRVRLGGQLWAGVGVNDTLVIRVFGGIQNYDLSARLRIRRASLREGGGPLAVEGACENSPISIVMILN